MRQLHFMYASDVVKAKRGDRAAGASARVLQLVGTRQLPSSCILIDCAFVRSVCCGRISSFRACLLEDQQASLQLVCSNISKHLDA